VQRYWQARVTSQATTTGCRLMSHATAPGAPKGDVGGIAVVVMGATISGRPAVDIRGRPRAIVENPEAQFGVAPDPIAGATLQNHRS